MGRTAWRGVVGVTADNVHTAQQIQASVLHSSWGQLDKLGIRRIWCRNAPPPGRSWGPGDLWPCPLSWGGVCARGGTQRAAMGPQCRASSVPVRSEAWNWSNGITPRILCSQPVTHATNSRTGRDCQPGTAEATSLPHPTAHLLRTGSSGQRRGPASGPRALWQPFTGEARPPTWV